MGKITVTHERCPDCGNRLKHYYYYCGQCGRQDVVDWSKTLILFLVFLSFFGLIIFFVFGNLLSTLCADESMFSQTLANTLLNLIDKQCK